MKASIVCFNLIKFFESLHDGDLTTIGLQPKMCPAGYWTEGYGHMILYKGKPLQGLENKNLAYNLSKVKTIEEAEELLEQDIEEREVIVNKLLKRNLEQYQFDALLSHTFNCGVSETLYKILNEKELDLEKLQIWWKTKYITSKGVVLPGLVKRRKVEYNLFITGNLNFNI